MIYFTSDLHFSHPLVAALRGFSDISGDIKLQKSLMSSNEFESHCDLTEHNKTIIRNINSVVKQTDELYILGDICSGTKHSMDEALKCLSKLNIAPTKRHLILGNHDGFSLSLTMRTKLAEQFSTIDVYSFINICNSIPVVLSHIPRRQVITGTYNHHGKKENNNIQYSPNVPLNILNLYGHTHTINPYEYFYYNSINIGLDAWRMNVVSEEKIYESLKRWNNSWYKETEDAK